MSDQPPAWNPPDKVRRSQTTRRSHSNNIPLPTTQIEALFAATAGNQFAGVNRPTAGARDEVPVQKGPASFQLYSLSTPNGQKVGIMLEELGIEYDAYCIGLGGAQFGKGFVGVNPNSKIPAAVDYDTPDGKPLELFESGAIVLYLAEKYKKFLPSDYRLRQECLNWCFWQMAGQGPVCCAPSPTHLSAASSNNGPRFASHR